MASESYTKIAVVPYEMVNQLNNHQQNTTPMILPVPEVAYLQNLDNDIKTILFNSVLPPDIKYKKYQELFNQYTTVLGNIRKPYEIEIKERKPVEQNHITDVTPEQKPHSSRVFSKERHDLKETHDFSGVVENLPDKIRPLARNFIEALQNNVNISWDAEGKIFVDDKPIQGSKINELLQDFMRDRKKTSPGFDEVTRILKEIDFSRSSIINKKRWDKTVKTINRRESKQEKNSSPESEEEEEEEEKIQNGNGTQFGSGKRRKKFSSSTSVLLRWRQPRWN